MSRSLPVLPLFLVWLVWCFAAPPAMAAESKIKRIQKTANRRLTTTPAPANTGSATAALEKRLEEGRRLLKGEKVARDPAKAAAIFLEVANLGYSEAQFMIGTACLVGEGIDKNLDQSIGWFRKAADQNNATAAFFLGRAYLKGEGVAKDPTKAAAMFLQSANVGFPMSMFLYARMCESGKEIPRNPVQAYIWFSVVLFCKDESMVGPVVEDDVVGKIEVLAKKLTKAERQDADRKIKELRKQLHFN
jgi:TPR repeat protein